MSLKHVDNYSLEVHCIYYIIEFLRLCLQKNTGGDGGLARGGGIRFVQTSGVEAITFV